MAFEERFRLLIDSRQADERSVAAARSALASVEAYYGIELTEEVGASLATHIAITIKRLLDGEALSDAPDALWQELEGHPAEVALATSIVASFENSLHRSITRDEAGFIALHLCKIVQSGVIAPDAGRGGLARAGLP